MNEILLTLFSITITISSIFFIGLNLCNIYLNIYKSSYDEKLIWCLSPIIGTGTIILFCQNLLYLNTRILYSSILLVVLSLITFLISIKLKRWKIKTIPKELIASAVLIYFLQGLGLLILGVSNYYGYGWVDLYNYVSQAQFFIDFPFHSNANYIDFLNIAQYYKNDRIGQTVLHSFISVITGLDAQQTFGITIILSPFISFFVFILISIKFNIPKKWGYLSATLASVSTAFATIHLECFLSQSLVIPFILVFPLYIDNLIKNKDIKSIIFLSFILSIISSIYTEIYPIAVSILILMILSDRILEKKTSLISNLKWLIVLIPPVLITALLFNPGFTKSLLIIITRSVSTSILGSIYPWGLSLEGLGRLWVGNQIDYSNNLYLFYIYSTLTIVIAILAILFLLKQYRNRSQSIAIGYILILAIPIFLAALNFYKNNQYQYQFYKLLLTFWPLFIFFGNIQLIYILNMFRKIYLILIVEFLLISISILSVGVVTYNSANPKIGDRGESRVLINNNFKEVRGILGKTHGKDIYIWWYGNEYFNGNWRSRWMTYFARNNNVWTMNPAPASGAGVGEYRELPTINLKSNNTIGISWAFLNDNIDYQKMSLQNADSPLFWFYNFNTEQDIRKVDSISSQAVIERKIHLKGLNSLSSNTWYPVWTNGVEGSASLISIKIDKEMQIRYDHWGYPDTLIRFNVPTNINEISLKIKINNFNHTIEITCDEIVKSASIPQAISMLNRDNKLGINSITSLLGGAQKISPQFDGEIYEEK